MTADPYADVPHTAEFGPRGEPSINNARPVIDMRMVVDWGPVIERVNDPDYRPMSPDCGYDGTDLFYGPTAGGQGLINWVYGDSHSGKTRLVMACLVGEVLKGRSVGILAFEDSGDEEMLDLLHDLGLSNDQVRNHVYLVKPAASHGHWMALVGQLSVLHGIRMWALDAFTSSAGYERIDSNNQDQIATWVADVCHGIASTGASVIVIDHIAKEASNPWSPIGSVQKKNGVTGAMVRVHHTDGLQGWTKARSGGVLVSSVKDRGGWHAQREPLAIFRFDAERKIYALAPAAEARAAHAEAKRKPWDALAEYIAEHPHATQKEMALAMGKDQSTISRWRQQMGRS